jgi:rhomboid protease GluP
MPDNDSSSPDPLDQLFAASEAAPIVRSTPLATHITLPDHSNPAQGAAANVQARPAQWVRSDDHLSRLTPLVWVTPTLLIANVAYFIVMVSQGVSPLQPDLADLLKWGANYAPLTWGGQPWRLLSNTFMHCGLVHLGVNMWALWSAGRILERLVGNVGYLIIYLTSGIAGSLASLWWNGDIISAGASGAIFGLLGAFAAFIWNRSDSFQMAALARLKSSLVTCIGFNLLLGFTIPVIDQAAHVGGLLSGLILGCILSQRLDQFAAQRRLRRNMIAAALSIVTLGILIEWHPPSPPDLLFKELAIYDELVPATIEKYESMAVAFSAKVVEFNAKVAEANAKDKTPNEVAKLKTELSKLKADLTELRNQFIALIETECLPAWQQVSQHVDNLTNIPRGRRELLHQVQTHLALRQEAGTLMVDFLRTGDRAKLAASKVKWKQADGIRKQLKE